MKSGREDGIRRGDLHFFETKDELLKYLANETD